MSPYSQTGTGTGERAGLHTALLLVRIALALPFVFHGAQIAFGAFGGPGLHGFVQASKGQMPLPVAVLVGYGEFLGGLGILFGVLSRLAGGGIALIMLGAIFLVHLKNGYSVQSGGFEYALTLLLLAVALMVAGPGRLTAARVLPLPKKTGTDEAVPALQ